MDEYISKTELMNTIYHDVAPSSSERCTQLLEAIISAPAVDVEKKVYGRWITNTQGYCSCSECQTEGSPMWRCCPVCETKMY